MHLLRGFHHDYNGRLERNGVIELINKQELGHGIYKVHTIKVKGIIIKGPNKIILPQALGL